MGQSDCEKAQAPVSQRYGRTEGQVLLTKGQKDSATRQVPSPHLTCPVGQEKTGRQSSAEGTHLPSAQGTCPEELEEHRKRSAEGGREGQKVMEDEH